MGACCALSNVESGINVNITDMNQKQSANEKTLQNDECSILVSSYTNELNYNVKYRESGKRANFFNDNKNHKKS